MIMEELKKYIEIQNLARETINYLAANIVSGMNEIEIKLIAEDFMRTNGIKDFWYYNIGAFVFVGERTAISISGKNYIPSDLKLKFDDIVTVDLSPEINSYWGDLSRTFIVKNGKVSGFSYNSIKDIDIDFEIKQSIKFIESLHEKMKNVIKPELSYENIYELLNYEIESNGYENLDFGKNLGHSIEKNKNDRVYIEKGNSLSFSNEKLFTFEPHVRKTNGKYGYKLENIYYFKNNVLKEL